ncbi:MAG: adenine phosphoribosyltransferase [bacterium]|nr:adenine phosphoribosyltransferase [bacterium]
MNLVQYIRDLPDWPKPGIIFRDITPLLKDKTAFAAAINWISEPYLHQPVDLIVGIESRGFILASGVAYRLGVGFVPARKPGKLPWKTVTASYQLEYGTDSLQIHQDAIEPKQKVVIIDDVLATGGTLSATIELVNKLQGEIVEIVTLIELTFLQGRQKLGNYPYRSLIRY